MRLYETVGKNGETIQVLSFEDTAEARSVGEHLSGMADGFRYYARGEEADAEDLDRAGAEARQDRELADRISQA